jgi:hypothetical protein
MQSLLDGRKVLWATTGQKPPEVLPPPTEPLMPQELLQLGHSEKGFEAWVIRRGIQQAILLSVKVSPRSLKASIMNLFWERYQFSRLKHSVSPLAVERPV